MLHRVPISSLILSLSLAGAAFSQPAPPPVGVTYDYPSQRGQAELVKTDPDRKLLTDGKIRNDGPGAVWGKWSTESALIDWQFEKPVAIKTVKVAIVHTKADSLNSHVERIELFGSSSAVPAENEFLEIPDAAQDIPFVPGLTQEITIPLGTKGNGLICQRLRMRLKSAKYQVVLTEVSFDAMPATAEQIKAAQKARQDLQPPELRTIQFLPAPMPRLTASGLAHPESIFGFCGHMLHTGEFFGNHEKFSSYWGINYTLPFVVSSHVGWVREPLYGSLFSGNVDDKSPTGNTFGHNRKMVEDDLAQYQQAGIKVMLAPFLLKADAPQYEPYLHWLISLARTYPNIKAIEMHNEPNLRGFWKYTPQDYVDSCAVAYKLIKKELPDLPVVVGSFSGWGHGQYGDAATSNYGGGGKQSPIAIQFAEEVFAAGLLNHADAVSAHPYRNYAAPEGGVELESPKDPLGFEKEIKTWWNLVQKHNTGKRPLKVHFSELGYSVSKAGYATVPTEERQADYASRLMMILLHARLDGLPLESVMWYDLKNDENKGEYESNFGMIASDVSSVRPAFLAFRRIAETFSTTSTYEPLAAATFNNEPENIKSYTWQNRTDRSLIVSFWRMNQLQRVDRNFPAELSLTLPDNFGRVQSVELTDLYEDHPRTIGFKQEGNRLIVPVQVTARAAWIQVKR